MNLPSISNRNLTLLRKLNQKKYRREERLFLAEGARAVEQIIDNGALRVKMLFFDESRAYWKRQPWKNHTEQIGSAIMAKNNFADVSDTDHPQGVLAVCSTPKETAPQDLANQQGLILATDGLQDPGNMGTIIRSASWFNVAGLLCGKGTVDLFHPKVVRATAGTTGTVPHAMVDLEDQLPFFEEQGWSVLLLDSGAGATSLREIKPGERTIIVIGNEAHGTDSSLAIAGREKVRITSPGRQEPVESLNAAMAASIALYVLAQ